MSWVLLMGLLISDAPIGKDELLGKFDPASHPDFVRIEPSDTTAARIYLRREAYGAFESMREAARAEGVELTILSATRPFDHQKRIWERKWKARATGRDPEAVARDIMRFSAMPGTSRHHWGTEVDLNSLENRYFESGRGRREYEWLVANAPRFGFHQVYTGAAGRPGYEEEKWHWSYAPLSRRFLERYLAVVTYADIAGFSGAETAGRIRAIEEYAAGVSTAVAIRRSPPATFTASTSIRTNEEPRP